MDGEDDDIYGGSTPLGEQQPKSEAPNLTADKQDPVNGVQEPKELEEGEEEGEEVEQDSDSDIDIITERPPGPELEQPKQVIAAPEPMLGQQSQPSSKNQRPSKAAKPAHDVTAQQALPKTNTLQKPGSEFPEVHASNVDVDADPIYEPVGKPIIELDFDTDPYMREHEKPWRVPGTDQSDYFNYGFDEFTWASYCFKQKSMHEEIKTQREQRQQMEMMFGPGIPGGPNGGQQGKGLQPGANSLGGGQQQQQADLSAMMANMGAMPSMPGMPDMSVVMQQMISQGINPTNEMDFQRFIGQQMMGQKSGGGQGQFVPNAGMSQHGNGRNPGGPGNRRNQRW